MENVKVSLATGLVHHSHLLQQVSPQIGANKSGA